MPTKLTQEEAEKKVESRGCCLKSIYIGGTCSHVFQCGTPNCNELFNKVFKTVVLKGNIFCASCLRKRHYRLLTQEEAEQRVKDRGCVLVGKYTGTANKHIFICSRSDCDRTFDRTFRDVVSPSCHHTFCTYHHHHHLTQEEAERRIKEKGCVLLDIYRTSKQQYAFKCKNNDCQGIFTAVFGTVIAGDSSFCSKCRRKHNGERIIERYLQTLCKELNIEDDILYDKSGMLSEIPIKPNEGFQRYDFQIPGLRFAIEFHGVQHFKGWSQIPNDFIQQNHRDKRKYINSYLLDITLLVISNNKRVLDHLDQLDIPNNQRKNIYILYLSDLDNDYEIFREYTKNILLSIVDK